jgi:hypothetical protein
MKTFLPFHSIQKKIDKRRYFINKIIGRFSDFPHPPIIYLSPQDGMECPEGSP